MNYTHLFFTRRVNFGIFEIFLTHLLMFLFFEDKKYRKYSHRTSMNQEKTFLENSTNPKANIPLTLYITYVSITRDIDALHCKPTKWSHTTHTQIPTKYHTNTTQIPPKYTKIPKMAEITLKW